MSASKTIIVAIRPMNTKHVTSWWRVSYAELQDDGVIEVLSRGKHHFIHFNSRTDFVYFYPSHRAKNLDPDKEQAL